MRAVARLFAVLAALLFGAVSAQAQIPAEERVPVVDPATLALMGFAPDAEAYVWTKGLYSGRAAELVPFPADSPPSRAPGGGSPDTFFAVTGREFRTRLAGGFSRGLTGGGGELFCAGGTDPFVDAQVQIPRGASLEFVRIWGWDSCAEDMEIFLQESCIPEFAPGDNEVTIVASVSTSGTPGNFSELLTMPSLFGVNNTRCVYWIRVRFDDTALSCDCGGNLVLYKVRVQYEFTDEGYVGAIGQPFPVP